MSASAENPATETKPTYKDKLDKLADEARTIGDKAKPVPLVEKGE